MKIDLDKIKKISKEKEDENWEFRSFLKRCDIPSEKIDLIVQTLFHKISTEIDCKICANCCKEVKPILNQEDIKRFSKGFGLSVVQFKKQYLYEDKNSKVYIFNKKSCPFLKDNLCSYYPYRPKDCMSYPHLHKNDFISRIINVIENYSICPIVFEVYESLKDEIWHTNNSEKRRKR